MKPNLGHNGSPLNRLRSQKHHRASHWLRGVCLALLLGTLNHSQAATQINGSISGTWTKSASPYVVNGNSTVPAGQTLTIQPGVTVIVGQGFNITVQGRMLALGTPTERITIRGATPSLFWDKIYIPYNNVVGDSRFLNCNISDAGTAIYLGIDQVTASMVPELSNCVFSNCTNYCIYGSATATSSGSVGRHYYPDLNARIQNCRFQNSSNGVHFYSTGGGTSSYFGQAAVNPLMANNLFYQISGVAVRFESAAASVYGGANPSAPIEVNNIFLQCGTALRKGGDLSLFDDVAGWNCFYSNRVNFSSEYPPSLYGTISMGNRNGIPCDAAENIFLAPGFAETTNFTLAVNSPCIDAGSAEAAFNDFYFPPSLGTIINDIGPNGGPEARVVPLDITRQPQSASSCPGNSATFSVAAEGSGALSYQWYFNGSAITGQTNATLLLSNLQTNQAGLYAVVVWNASGSVTSASAQLSMSDACVEVHRYVGLTITGQAGRAYVLKYSTSAANTNFATWTPLGTNTMTANGWFFVDKQSPFEPMRFYGVKLYP